MVYSYYLLHFLFKMLIRNILYAVGLCFTSAYMQKSDIISYDELL